MMGEKWFFPTNMFTHHYHIRWEGATDPERNKRKATQRIPNLLPQTLPRRNAYHLRHNEEWRERIYSAANEINEAWVWAMEPIQLSMKEQWQSPILSRCITTK